MDELQADAAKGAAARPRQPDKIRLKEAAEAGLKAWAAGPLPDAPVEVRIHPDWSRLGAAARSRSSPIPAARRCWRGRRRCQAGRYSSVWTTSPTPDYPADWG